MNIKCRISLLLWNIALHTDEKLVFFEVWEGYPWIQENGDSQPVARQFIRSSSRPASSQQQCP